MEQASLHTHTHTHTDTKLVSSAASINHSLIDSRWYISEEKKRDKYAVRRMRD